MSLALSTCVLFIWFMQLVNGAQFLITTLLLVLFTSAPTGAVLLAAIVRLTKIYASL